MDSEGQRMGEAQAGGQPPAGALFPFQALKGQQNVLTKQAAAELEASGGCSICAQELREGQVVLEVFCGHVFHDACLQPWLAKHPTCPLCRSEVLDVPAVLGDLVHQVHRIRQQRLHHHELLNPLELLARLAKDKNHALLCAEHFGVDLLLEIGANLECPMIRAQVLDILLAWSLKDELHADLRRAQEALFPMLSSCLEQPRPNIRSAACAMVWNLAVPKAVNDHPAGNRLDLSGFLPRMSKLVQDSDNLVAFRARRALWFMSQDVQVARRFVLEEHWPPLLACIEEAEAGSTEWSFCLHLLVCCIEAEVAATARPTFPQQLFWELFRLLEQWLEKGVSHVPLVHRATLLLSRVACRDPLPEYRDLWLKLLDDGRPLRSFLQVRPSNSSVCVHDFEEWRACVLGVTWNLAIHPAWRKQLGDRVLEGLLAISELQVLETTTRERLLTALWHLSKDVSVTADKRWENASAALCDHVVRTHPEVQLTGLELLENLYAEHAKALAPHLMKLLWCLAKAQDGKVQGVVLRMLLGYTVSPPSTSWLQLPADYGELLGEILQDFQNREDHHHGKASLIGIIWNLSMDSAHHEAIGRAVIDFIPALLQDPCRVVVERTITAAFCLTCNPGNASRLRKGFGPSVPLLLDLMHSLTEKEKRYQLLNLMLSVESVVKVREQSDVSDGSGKTLLMETLQYMSEPEVFEDSVGRDGCMLAKRHADCRLALAGLNFVMHVSPCPHRRHYLLTDFPALQPDGAILRLISAKASTKVDHDARSSGIGIVWNLAMNASPAEAAMLADRALWRLLEVADCAANHPSQVDIGSCQRLATTLFYLARDRDVCERPEWSKHEGSLCSLIEMVLSAVASPAPPSLSSACGLLALMVRHHKHLEWVPRTLPVLLRTLPDCRIPSGCAFVQCTELASGREWLLAHKGPSLLPLIWQRIQHLLDGRPVSEPQMRAKVEWLLVLWNLFTDDKWRGHFDPQNTPLIIPFLVDTDASTAQHCANMAAEFSRREAHLRQLCKHPAPIWMLLERTTKGNCLNDDGLSDFLTLCSNTLTYEIEHNPDGGVLGCKTVLKLLSSPTWVAKVAPREDWPRSLEAEVRLLSLVVDHMPAELWASPMLSPSGCIDVALRIQPGKADGSTNTAAPHSSDATRLVVKLQKALKLSSADLARRLGTAASTALRNPVDSVHV